MSHFITFKETAHPKINVFCPYECLEREGRCFFYIVDAAFFLKWKSVVTESISPEHFVLKKKPDTGYEGE